jgi:ATP-dependent helicase/nuclease subunit B
MSQRELLVSPPGTGKTATCIELFRTEILRSKSGIESRSFFVLPSREHAERIQNLVLKADVPGHRPADAPVAGLFNAHILTINDLTSRFLGFAAGRTPNDAVRRRALERALQESTEGKGALKYFADVASFKGFRRLILDAIKEFSQSLLTVEAFERLCQPLLKDAVFRMKFRDFTLVWKRYQAELERLGFREPQEGIAELLERRMDPPRADLVIFDGFYHFTRAQRELVRASAAWSDRCVVTLTLPDDAERREGLFEYPERTLQFLLEAGFREKKIRPVNHRVKDGSLLRLEKGLFRAKPDTISGAPSSIEIFEASDLRSEIELVAREIKRLYRERELHYSDICVILRTIGPYERVIGSVFSRFGIPVAVHERKKLIESGLARTIVRLLDLTIEGWKREDLLAFLRSSYLRAVVSEEDVADLEAVSFSQNVREGRQAWVEAVRASAPAARALAKALSWEKKFLAAANAVQFGREIGSLFGEFGLLEGFHFRGGPDEEEVWKAVQGILRAARASAPGGGRPVEPETQIREFRESLETGLFSLRPPGRNRVQVYDVVMALPKEYKVVFLSGLLEKSFPLAAAEDPLFKDSERQKINREGLVLEERAWRLAGERYFFYIGVTRAKEKLYLTYPLYDAEGRPSLPSFFVEEVRKIFPALLPLTQRLGELVPPPAQWAIEEDAELGLATDLFSGGRPLAARELLIERAQKPALREIAEWGYTAGRARIESEVARRLLGGANEVLSPTRLEMFATCAFKHFAARALKLKEPLEGKEFLEKGSVLHKVLEEFYKALPESRRADPEFWRNTPLARELLLGKLDEVIASDQAFRHEPVYRRKAYRESMRRTLSLYLEREAASGQREFEPAYFEWVFGLEGRPALEIEGSSGPVRIGGRIDRIDLTRDRRRALVIDYKLSRRSDSIKERLRKGIELQLPLYILAAEKFLGVEVARGELQLLQSAGTEPLTLDSDEDRREILGNVQARVREIAARMREADISVHSKSCEHCAFSAVCRFEKWRLAYVKEGA